MLKARHVVLGLALLVAVGGDARSQLQRRSQSQGQPQQFQNQAVPDERGSEKSPFVVKITPTPKSEGEAAQEIKDRAERTALDQKLVKFNGDLAYYTWILIWAAGFQFAALVAQAVFVARSIRHSRLVERAYVSGGGAFLADPASATFQLTVDNYGKTPARVVNVEIGFCNANNIPAVPQYPRNDLIGQVIPPGRSGHPTPVTIHRDQMTGDVIFGRFWYRDIFTIGGRHIFPSSDRHSGFILHITPTLCVQPINAPPAYTNWD